MRVDPQFIFNTVSALDNTTANEQTITNEISTGVSVNQPGDNPTAFSQNVSLSSQISADDTFTQTASSTEGMLQVADSTLGSVVSQLTEAISVATQGSNGTLNSSNLKAIATQLTGIRDEVVSLANTSYLGNYLFSGSQGSTAPFTIDTSTSPASVTYNGDDVTSSVVTPNGQSIQTNVPGDQIFTATGANVIGTLNALIADFSSGTVSSTATSDLTSLNTALNYVSQQRTTIDNSITALTAASTDTSSEEEQLKSAQDTLIQTNTATAATELSAAETQQSALTSLITAIDGQGTLFAQI
ncbi:flagellar hook-associated protein FlgL [Silvibacterium sp.]|uniref:flagellar hook-associated protein FlgL n=1 Tax=Silvibacterium sp. TaxID=1964179 RepID=UPI0039E293B9